MNKQYISILSSLIICFGASTLSAGALPGEVVADQAAGLLGSPVAQLPVQDPVTQQAIEWIQMNQPKPEEHKLKRKPETTIVRRSNQRKYILGGPEVVPM